MRHDPETRRTDLLTGAVLCGHRCVRAPTVPARCEQRGTLRVVRALTHESTATSVPRPTGRALVRVERDGDFARVTMDVPERRNALSLDHMRQLLDAVRAVGASDARGVLLAAEGPVFCAGHDFRDMVDADLAAVRELLAVCTELMTTLQSIPQPVVARVHALATAAGCQLVATADLAVASEEAGFAIPGGKGGWFCHTPLVAVARALPRKRALEMAFTGDVSHAGQPELEGAGQARLLRPGRPRPAQGLRLRDRAHGRHQPNARRARGHDGVPREAPSALRLTPVSAQPEPPGYPAA